MINARAITINSVILFFMKFISMVKIYCFLKQWFYHNYCFLLVLHMKRSFTHLKGLLLTYLLTHKNLKKDMDLIQVANNIVLRKSGIKEYFGQFLQSSNQILCIQKYVCVVFNTRGTYYLSSLYSPTTHSYEYFPKPKFMLPHKAKKPPRPC